MISNDNNDKIVDVNSENAHMICVNWQPDRL